MGKLTLLYFATAGFYVVYWFYLCWRGAESVTGRRYFRVGRAAFAVIFVYELFHLIFNEERRRGGDYPWRPAKLAWVFIGAAVLQVLFSYSIDRFGLGCWSQLSAFILVLIVQFYSIYQAQLALNRIEGDPFGRRNEKLTMQTHIAIVAGLYIWFNLISNCLYHQSATAPNAPATVPAPNSSVL